MIAAILATIAVLGGALALALVICGTDPLPGELDPDADLDGTG